ncbi:hypothetical protein O0L34_g5187 [Tuta absoluta]|nr:hypothetical protein O0L34_g5187 [Tuta absoluta]
MLMKMNTFCAAHRPRAHPILSAVCHWSPRGHMGAALCKQRRVRGGRRARSSSRLVRHCRACGAAARPPGAGGGGAPATPGPEPRKLSKLAAAAARPELATAELHKLFF